MLDQEFEKSEYFSKPPFETFQIKRGNQLTSNSIFGFGKSCTKIKSHTISGQVKVKIQLFPFLDFVEHIKSKKKMKISEMDFASQERIDYEILNP